MSKKNNKQKDTRYIKGLIKREDIMEARRKEMRDRKENARVKAESSEMDAQRKAKSRKPKVAPVVGSKVKMEKMIARQMKTMSLSSAKATKSKKLNMDDDSSESEDEAAQGEEAMETTENAALLVPKLAYRKSRIGKAKPGLSRSQIISLKKEIRRRLKFGTKDGKKAAKKMKAQLEESRIDRRGGKEGSKMDD